MRFTAITVCFLMLFAAALSAAPVEIGEESIVPINPRSEWSRYVNWRPADGDTVTLNPPRMTWFYNADAPEDFGDTMHMFTLQIAENPQFDDPAVDVVTPFNFYNTLPALDPRQTWHWRVGYDVGTEREQWSDVRSFEIASDATTWDRSALEDPGLEEAGHPRVLLNPAMIDEIRALAATHEGSAAAFEAMRQAADSVLEKPWWDDFPETDRADEPEQAFYRIAHDLAMVAFVWRITEDDRYSGVIDRAVTWASYPAGGRASPEGLGGDGNEDATQGNEFLALLFDWLYEDMTDEQRAVMINSLEWRVDHIMNSFSWRGQRSSGPMLRMTFRSDAETATWEAEDLQLSGGARVLDDEDASGDRIVELASEDAEIALETTLDASPYVITVAGHGPDGNRDAFFVTVDDQNPKRSFIQDRGEVQINFTVDEPGEHTIRITPSEVGVRIDAVTLNVHGDQRLKLSQTRDWKEFEWQVQAPAQGTRLRVEPFNYYAGGEVWWDDLFVGHTPDGPNMLTNGDFDEAGDAGPAAWSFHNFGTDSSPGYEDGRAGIICPDSSDRGAWGQTVAIDEPGTYYVRGRYTTSGAMMTANVRESSLSGMVSSHPFEASMATAVCGLVLYEHSDLGREWFDLMLNYLLGVTSGYGPEGTWNEGAGYGSSKNKWLTNSSLYFDTTLAGANLGNNPFYTNLGSWLRRIIPVGMDHHAWGNQRNASRGNHLASFRKLGHLTGDGRFMYNWYAYGGEDFNNFRPWIEYVLPAFYGEPEAVPEQETTEVFDIGGWAMAASGPPSDPATYQEGAGVILQCRPRGGYGHSFNSDGSVQLHAYGEMLNHGGGTSANLDAYPFHTMSHNVVMIDGLGQAQPPRGMRYPTYGHITGHREGELADGGRYVYFAADPTDCYPDEPGSFSRWSFPLREPYTERALPYLDSYVRHVLFVRDSYFVIFDDLRTSQPSTFTWLWHILQDHPLQVDQADDRFVIDYMAGDVPVRLMHIARPEALELDNREGLEGRINPFTGEDYRETLRGDIIEAHNLWISNAEQAEDFTFLAVVYPQPPGGEIPAIERIDDYTVRVGDDLICFDPASAAAGEADLLIDPGAFIEQ
ncbi:MAG: DUF4962 domain-containing protein [Armatimonadota bacterium]